MAVHQWLESSPDARGYKKIDPRKNTETHSWFSILQGKELKYVAYQHYRLFPTHYFKASYALNKIVGEDTLISWLQHKQRICLLDIGCGAGAATAAFIEAVILLKETGKITSAINILAIGVDPNIFSILLYKKTLKELQSNSTELINLEFVCFLSSFPEATPGIIDRLKQERDLLQVPCLSNLLTINLNVISPLSQRFKSQENDYKNLLDLDPEIDIFLSKVPKTFGNDEAQAYRQMIEDVPIDMMYLLNIVTENSESDIQADTDSSTTLETRSKEMAFALNKIIGKSHYIEQIHEGKHEIYFENPQGSYGIEQLKLDRTNKPTAFYTNLQKILSTNLTEDED